MKLSIIVVSYNTAPLTIDCLESIYRETSRTDFEVIAVDNDSRDDSVALISSRVPQAELMALDENVGFAAANNRAAVRAKGEYLLLLNPDTVVLDRAVEKLLSFAEMHPRYCVYGGDTVFPDGSRNPTSGWMRAGVWSTLCAAVGLSRLFPHSRLFNSESVERWDRRSPLEVGVVTGCLLLIRKKDWERLGGFDPSFFMYAEDADLCLRARETIGPCVLVPGVCVVHYGGASESVRFDKTLRLFRAKVQLFKKHYGPLHARAAVIMLFAWIYVRIAAFGLACLFRPELAGRRDEWRRMACESPRWVC